MKSLNKTKRKLVWCIDYQMDLKPYSPGFGFPNQPKPKSPKIQCPFCKKKFNPRIFECGDPGCWHIAIPPHKKYVKNS